MLSVEGQCIDIHNDPFQDLHLVVTLCKQHFYILRLGNVRHIAHIESSSFSNGLQRVRVILSSRCLSTKRSTRFILRLVPALAPAITLLEVIWLERRACRCCCIIARPWWCIYFGTPIAGELGAACRSVGALLSRICEHRHLRWENSFVMSEKFWRHARECARVNLA